MLEEPLREALTFDDVLLVPAYSEVLPRDVDIRDAALPRASSWASRSSPRRWTRSPRPAPPSPWRAKAASASSTRTSRPDEQAREVEQVKRAETGIVRRPDHGGPATQPPRRARAHEAPRHLRPPGGGGRPPGRHPHDARHPLRDATSTRPCSQAMTPKERLVTVSPRRSTADEARALLHKHRIEKLLVVDRSGARLVGLITIKDLSRPSASPAPRRTAAAGSAWAPRSAPARDRDERVAAPGRRGRRRHRGRHRARPLQGRARRRARDQEPATRTSRCWSPATSRPRRPPRR